MTCLYTLLGAYGRWYTLTSSLSSTGSFEPYKPYGISVYPRFKDGIGLPQTVNAYSRQKGKSPKTQRGSHKEQAEVWESGCRNFEEEGKEINMRKRSETAETWWNNALLWIDLNHCFCWLEGLKSWDNHSWWYFHCKAPSMVPKIQIKKTWKAHIELSWDEIPLDQRNGFIQSYKVFYWNKNEPVHGRLKTFS